MSDAKYTELGSSTEFSTQSETAVRLLRNFEDSDFRNHITELMENAPNAVKTINEDYKGTEKDKFSHTKGTLQLLDTTGLNENDRFVARTGMMFHDTDPGKAIDDLCKWTKSGLIKNTEAVEIMRQVWWHDLLGVDVNKNLDYTDQLPYVIPDDGERAINLRIFEADIKYYHLGETYKVVLEQARKLKNVSSNAIDLQSAKQGNLLDNQTSLKPPGDDDIFIHGIYPRGQGNQNAEIAETTPKILLNMLVEDQIKSTSRILPLESFKIGSDRFLGGKPTDDEFNVFRLQPGNFPAEIGPFGQTENNWLTILYFGRDIKNDCLVKPLNTAKNIDYVAGLVNRFDTNGKILGAELPLDKAYFIIKASAAEKLIPLLKLEALRLNKDPEEWIQQKVIIHDRGDLEEITTKLFSGELNIKEHNTKALLDSLGYSGYVYEDVLRNNFDLIEYDGKQEKHNGVRNDDDYKCEVIDSEDSRGNYVKHYLEVYLKAFPWLANNPQVSALLERLDKGKSARSELLRKVGDGKENYFDSDTETLYIEGQMDGFIVPIRNVESFTRDIENKGDVNSEKNIWNIILKNGKKLIIKKSSFDDFNI